jgi:hypothetical protein
MPYVPQTQSKSAQIASAEKIGRMPSGIARQSTATLSKRPMELYQKYLKMKESMTEEEKRELLLGLRKTKENNTSISPQEPMWISEEQPNSERNVISKTFTQNGDFDPFVNKNRGIQFAPKEIDTIANFKNIATPTAQDQFMVRFEKTDDFGNNTTTVIKKHRQGNQLVFTAFTKHDSSRPEPEPESPELGKQPPRKPQMGGKPQMGEKPSIPTASKPSKPSMPSLKELATGQSQENQITITKTIPFQDEIKGADILADFLRTLDL